MLGNQKVEDRVPQKFESLIVIDSHFMRSLMILHGVEMLFERLVGHRLDK